MSTAKNHAKRSHRSHYRSRAWNGSRRSVIKPTVGKSAIARFIQKIRQALTRKNTKKKGDE